MDIWSKLNNTTSPIVLYGMGNGADLVLKQLQKIGKKPVGVFASDEFVRGQEYRGYIVKRYDDLARQYPDMIILVCFGSDRPEVLQRIGALSEVHELYCPDVPVYGDTIFDLNFARKHAVQLQKVYDLLADPLSKQTFQDIIEFKLSGNDEFLKKCQYNEGLFAPIKLTDGEYYVDLGAYRGDTVEQFVSSVRGYASILAVEPSKTTYRKLCDNVRRFDRVHTLYGAIADFDGEGYIVSAGRGSALRNKGKTVPTYTIDTILFDKKVTLIKMDIEGKEAGAIKGGREVIAAQKPKMIVAAYHCSEDVFELPLLVNSIRPDYRILLRHAPHNLAWETNYYFI